MILEMTIKKQNNKVVSLIIFSVIALAIIFLFSLDKQLSKDTSDKPKLATQSDKPSNNASDTNQDSNLQDQPTNQIVDSNTSTEESTTDSSNLSSIKDKTTKVFTSPEQKKVRQVIGQFENSFAQADYSTVFKLFMAEVQDSQSEADIQTKSPSVPKSFDIKSIDIRSDSTVFAQINETRADGLAAERFMELAPVDKSYQISRYFSKADQTTYAGFINNP
ncbi:MAG: hypothetical protein UT11_C0029G0004 [Berkelbacteria bacterium GW2011_GWA2_38_9]|uniref:Uncharacterized protein n=1 Tax=Berkelbacteria bacterium GW2011_GWA2_38_9 TaxID=1618334 RepID=A0A0G0LMV4_9BACT|nr:MAG: hypothetical protein UT11_C0029G0004 [Berkelbacteria bacterium GW2011_GWA2_38_9]